MPNGKIFELFDNENGAYLYHKSGLGEFFFGSDAITHSYKNHKRKQLLIKQIPNKVNKLFNTGSTVGSYIVFPKNRIDGKQTINQARGTNSLIDDRFDLTLECIRLFYMGQKNPLYSCLMRYKKFFDLFDDFIGYIHFFLLDDLINENSNIKFYLLFNGFKNSPTFSDISQYLLYKKGVINFINSRNKRIKNYIKLKKTEYDTST